MRVSFGRNFEYGNYVVRIRVEMASVFWRAQCFSLFPCQDWASVQSFQSHLFTIFRYTKICLWALKWENIFHCYCFVSFSAQPDIQFDIFYEHTFLSLTYFTKATKNFVSVTLCTTPTYLFKT